MSTVQEREARYIINTYNRRPEVTPCLVRGEGARVWDEAGKEYLDFLGGLAVNVLGHCHPAVVGAIREQAAKLLHTSNLYYTVPQVELAELLVQNSFPGRVFFANSGAEANEAAIKLVRKHSRRRSDSRRFKIITANRSFHGRTMATVTATAQAKYHQGFEPLLEGFSYAIFNDLGSFCRQVDDETAAIMIEPVQGEGGVHVADARFLRGLQELCRERELLLIFDEVQCGMGRTGRLWAYQHFGVEPDILTTAKGLGGGLPIGAMIAREEIAASFQPGDHASTFGGNPVACSAAVAVMKVLLATGFLEEVQRKGAAFGEKLLRLHRQYPQLIKEKRGLGFMAGLELIPPAAATVQRRCQESGLLINAIGDHVLRFLPPLIVADEELEEGLAVLESSLKEVM